MELREEINLQLKARQRERQLCVCSENSSLDQNPVEKKRLRQW